MTPASPLPGGERPPQDERQLLAETARLLAEEAGAARRRMELLVSAGDSLARSLDPDETLLAVARTLVPGVADWCRIDLLDEAGVLRRKLAYHADPRRSREALEMALRLQARPETVGGMAWIVQTGQSHHGDFAQPGSTSDPATAEFTRAFSMRSFFALPLVARGRTIGAMAVLQAESGRVLSPDDRALVLELARRAGVALDNARLFAEAEAARRLAEQANRAKDEFLAVLGHELRNPLAPIGTALELMARRAPQTSVEERAVIGRQFRHLTRLIDDLLDVSRITQGKVQLRREPVELQAVAANAIELTRPLYERHRHPVALELPEQPALVLGDFVRLSQVMANLLVNSAKFTPAEGRVTLSLRADGADYELRVQDTGSGIAPDLLPRVFEVFVQGHQASNREAGGLGLGLAIVRSLVALHGGSVHAASEGEGRGASFTVRLPAAAPVPASAPGTSSGPRGRTAARILVVDDNRDAALSLAELLQVEGHETRTAADAPAAMKALASFRPQLALLDIGLPLVDGYQLAGMMRASPEGQGLRLVALTGYGQDQDRARARGAGFDEHLVKPVPIDQLLAVLENLLGEG